MGWIQIDFSINGLVFFWCNIMARKSGVGLCQSDFYDWEEVVMAEGSWTLLLNGGSERVERHFESER